MPKPIRIVTDSSAQFLDQGFIRRHKITIVPLEIHFEDRQYRENVDMDAEHFFRRASESNDIAELAPPKQEAFEEVYGRLNAETDRILSIHLSRSFHNTFTVAKNATRSLLGRCQIEVMDAQTTSVGLAVLVEAAAKMAQDESLDIGEIVRRLRKLIPRIYSVFYVESLDYIQKRGLLGEAQSILGTMLSLKPFITIEEGEMILIEKVRTRQQAVDKLVEFVTEFSSVKHLAILQNTPYPTEQTRLLQDRLATEFEARNFPVLMYNPSLGCFLGPDATGIVIFEENTDIADAPRTTEDINDD